MNSVTRAQKYYKEAASKTLVATDDDYGDTLELKRRVLAVLFDNPDGLTESEIDALIPRLKYPKGYSRAATDGIDTLNFYKVTKVKYQRREGVEHKVRVLHLRKRTRRIMEALAGRGEHFAETGGLADYGPTDRQKLAIKTQLLGGDRQ